MDTSKNNPKILIADDSDMNRKLLNVFVQSFGYEPILAVDGKDALNKLTPNIDLVLLDVLMPVMDGLTATKMIRDNPDLFDIPIIIITSLTDKESRIKAVEAGANDFITKPVDKNELKIRMTSLLKMKQAQDQIKAHRRILEQTVQERTAELYRKNKQLEAEIRERMLSEKRLQSAQSDLAKAQHIARMGSWVWDIIEDHITWSNEAYVIFNLPPKGMETTYEYFLRLVHPEDRSVVARAIEMTLWHHGEFNLDHRVVLENGNVKIVHQTAEVERDELGNPIRVIGTIQDITERKAIENELAKLSMAIEKSTSIVFITDVDGNIEYVNSRFEEVSGYSKLEAIGQTPRILASGQTSLQVYKEMWDTIKSGHTWRGDFKNKKKNGEFFWVRGLVTPIGNERGQITHFLAIQEDISDKVLAEKRIQYMATFDTTTGLLNRNHFMHQLSQLITDRKPHILTMIDLDGFRLIREIYGHNMADEFLKSLARIIKKCLEGVAKNDLTIGRLGDNQIAGWLAIDDFQQALAIVEKLRQAIEDFRFSGEDIRVTASIGVASYPEHDQTGAGLIRKAEAAVHRAKKLGKNRCHFYSEEDDQYKETKISQMRRIVKALEEDRFIPWFQPIMNLKTNKIHHYEALARLHMGNGKWHLPGSFISMAETMGLVKQIDRMIIEKTLKYQSMLSQRKIDLSFAMNISAKHLGDGELLNFIRSTIQQTGARADKLVFEITETAAIEDLDRAKQFIDQLKSLGCKFSLDDFGVGFTSFMYLKEMNVDFLKIDGMFVRRIHENPHDQGIVQAISTIAKGLNIKTIAEFVEKKQSLAILDQFGVDYAQGFLVGKPGQKVLED